MLKLDGDFDSCIIGVSQRCGGEDILAYDALKVMKLLVSRDGMTVEEAQEYFEYNIIGSYVGRQTPCFIYPYDLYEQELS